MLIKNTVLSQLPDYRAWSTTGPHSGPISLLDYIGFVATLDTFFGFAELFSPELAVYKGYHFLASGFSEAIYEAWIREGRSPEEAQRAMNHVHMSTIFQQREATDEAADEAARVLMEIWKRTLAVHNVNVEVVGRGIQQASVTFFERPLTEPGRA